MTKVFVISSSPSLTSSVPWTFLITSATSEASFWRVSIFRPFIITDTPSPVSILISISAVLMSTSQSMPSAAFSSFDVISALLIFEFSLRRTYIETESAEPPERAPSVEPFPTMAPIVSISSISFIFSVNWSAYEVISSKVLSSLSGTERVIVTWSLCISGMNSVPLERASATEAPRSKIIMTNTSGLNLSAKRMNLS